MNKQKIIGVVVVIAIILGIGGYAYYHKEEKQPEVVKTEESVAKVNGVAITKSAYDSQLAASIASLKAQGVADADSAEKLPALKTQVLNDLINNELVNQGIASAKISATSQEIETQYQALLTQLGGADKLKVELDKAQIDEAKLRENIARQVTVQKYLVANINVASTTVTDAEINQFYKDNTKGQEKPPALKDVKDQIRQQLTFSKEQALISAFLATLRAKAQVETTLQ